MKEKEDVKKDDEEVYTECPKCERRVKETDKWCPYCKYDLVNRPKIEKDIFYKKWWFWGIIILVILIIAGLNTDNTSTTTSTNIGNNISNSIQNKTNNTKIEKAKVNIIDFSKMTKEEIQNWCNTSKVVCSITDEYSDTISKGMFIRQSQQPNTTIYEGDKIIVVYSLGKEPTTEQRNALKKAESYCKTMHMSKKGVYKQLTSEYGEGFSAEAAQYAIDNVIVDWKENALEKAKNYQTTMHMSKKGVYKQLTSEYGENFTKEEAQYAIDNLEK